MTVSQLKKSCSNSIAREACVQFLYQCECERLHIFSEGIFVEFKDYMQLLPKVANRVRDLAEYVFLNRIEIDGLIRTYAKNWSIERMAIIDKSILRVCIAELLMGDVPYKVVLDEAIELAKKYGSDQSSQFVNGIADKAARDIIGRGVTTKNDVSTVKNHIFKKEFAFHEFSRR